MIVAEFCFINSYGFKTIPNYIMDLSRSFEIKGSSSVHFMRSSMIFRGFRDTLYVVLYTNIKKTLGFRIKFWVHCKNQGFFCREQYKQGSAKIELKEAKK